LEELYLTIAPSLSAAVADIAIRAGGDKYRVFTGLVTMIVGGTLDRGVNGYAIVPDEVMAPELSVALAVRL